MFGKRNTHVSIYENMFTDAEIERLSDFFGVPANPQYTSIRVNKTKSPVGQSASLEAEIRAEYKDVYEFCNERFHDTRYLWK